MTVLPFATQIKNGCATIKRDCALEVEVTLCVRGVNSPILANIYLHELDQFMAEMKADFDQGKERRRTPEYRHLKGVIGRKRAVLATLKAEGADVTSTEVATLLAELEGLEKRLLLTPSADPMDPGYRRLSYCRYADDCVPRTY